MAKFLPNVALKGYREAAGLTQAQLAAQVHVSQSVIARLETGESKTSGDMAARIAPALGRDPRDLFPSLANRVANHGETDQEVLRRALNVGQRLAEAAEGDNGLAAEIAGLVYALLIRDRDGYPISDDERTVELIETLVRRLRRGR